MFSRTLCLWVCRAEFRRSRSCCRRGGLRACYRVCSKRCSVRRSLPVEEFWWAFALGGSEGRLVKLLCLRLRLGKEVNGWCGSE